MTGEGAVGRRGYKWARFAEGNVANARSGARSPRVYGALAEQLAAGLVEDRPDVAAYPEAVAAWATAEAQAALMRRHLEEVGPIGDDGAPREAPLAWLVRLENLAARRRVELGLDPRSEAQLAKDRAAASVLAVDLGALAERGRQALEAREAAGIAPPPDLAGQALEAVIAAAPPRRGGGTFTEPDEPDETDDDTVPEDDTDDPLEDAEEATT